MNRSLQQARPSTFTAGCLLVATFLCGNTDVQGAMIANHIALWTDPATSTDILVQTAVFDELHGDPSKYEWRYVVSNMGYDPDFGVTNGLSGFKVIFAGGPIPELADIAHPLGWDARCCGASAPFGLEWEIPGSRGLGVLPGLSAVFTFSTAPRQPIIVHPIAPFVTSTGYSFKGETRVNAFTGELLVPQGNRSAVPEPSAGLLLASGLLMWLGWEKLATSKMQVDQ